MMHVRMMKTEKKVVALLSKLISINSENPGAYEHGMVRFCRSHLSGLGFKTRVITCSGRPNLIATFGRKNKGPKIVFNGHADTQPAISPYSSSSGWRSDPFTAKIDGNRLYGLGSADMKGGIASALVAAENIVREHALAGSISFHIVADEEIASRKGMKFLSRKHPELLHADLAIVLEPTELKISDAQVGNLWLEFTVRGMGGHSGNPYILVNPIEKAMVLSHVLKKEISKRPYPTFTIATFRSGSHPGSVPDTAVFCADIRIPPDRKREEYINAAIRVVKSFERSNSVSVSIKAYDSGGHDPSYVSGPNQYLQILKECAGTDMITLSGGTDATFYNSIGTDAVVFGPGSLAQAHKPNEYTKISQLVSCTRYLENFLRRTVT